MTLYLDQNVTSTTSSYNKVFVDTHQHQRALFLETYHYKELVNPAQLNHVIHDMVVTHGFMMDSHHNDKFVFTHPHNSGEETTYYNYYPNTMEMEKVTRRFLNFV